MITIINNQPMKHSHDQHQQQAVVMVMLIVTFRDLPYATNQSYPTLDASQNGT